MRQGAVRSCSSALLLGPIGWIAISICPLPAASIADRNADAGIRSVSVLIEADCISVDAEPDVDAEPAGAAPAVDAAAGVVWDAVPAA